MRPLLIAATVLVSQVEATNPANETKVDKAQFERWQKYYRGVAAEYQMEQGGQPSTRLKFHPDPVLSYANPAGGRGGHGAMFVWTRDGRPEIFGAIWSWRSGDRRLVVHEMHSLSLQPLTATRKGEVFWSPKGPGIDPWPVPDAPAPAATPALRLTQMRSIVREFSATTVRGTVERHLQFRPQPVYRFEQPTTEHDGALFVAFEDWDPELLMLVETRTTPNGPRWHAGFARFTNLPVSARHKRSQVWSFEESPSQGPLGGFDQRFYAVHGVDALPAIRDE